MPEIHDQLGEIIERVDNLTHSLKIPMPAPFHVKTMSEILPEIVKDLQKILQGNHRRKSMGRLINKH